VSLKSPDLLVLIDVLRDHFDYKDHEGSFQKVKQILDEKGYDTSTLRESLFGKGK